MHRALLLTIGFGFGFGIAFATIAAFVLFGLGVGGHYLVVRDRSVAQVISYDPSTVASRAPYPAAVAVGLAVCYLVIWLKLGQHNRHTSQAGQS